MSQMELDDLTADALREFGNIGAGHAATALSVLLEGRVAMSVTDARFCPFRDIVDVVGGPEQLVAAVFIRISGEIPGNMFVLFSLGSVDRLLDQLIEPVDSREDYSDLDLSAVAEVGNILTGAYVTAISDLCNIQLNQSVPSVAIDMAAAILDIGLMMTGYDENEAILISTSLAHGQHAIDGHFFMLPDVDGTQTLLSVLRRAPEHG
ncbi:chemotaxis protein CheC [Alicyclobacillus fastidiosus]|uniref:Chemotaxis protein CheC n=1 Tax=Alicyclobacillus fastidiosus TaxID=392011 RepID=A0ABV5AGP9_9BACL|nr:chemotaxis protein CheC [Alicyclobacillus fastidiosus]WEH07907.1 chemotaxis protein CheC [Alicyclobacillus fastidiosus]